MRLIAATNRDLSAMTTEGQFRQDLFYRLNVFPIRLPALRERNGDIPLLVKYFVAQYSRKLNRQITRIPDAALEALTRYPWPGNVRDTREFHRAVRITVTRLGIVGTGCRTCDLRSCSV